MLKQIKDKILGKKYRLSLAFVSPGKMRKINRTYRSKDKTADVLSFAFSKSDGEILFNRSLKNKKRLGRLFVHGCLHLKGMKHSSKMENEEKKWQNTFQLE